MHPFVRQYLLLQRPLGWIERYLHHGVQRMQTFWRSVASFLSKTVPEQPGAAAHGVGAVEILLVHSYCV